MRPSCHSLLKRLRLGLVLVFGLAGVHSVSPELAWSQHIIEIRPGQSYWIKPKIRTQVVCLESKASNGNQGASQSSAQSSSQSSLGSTIRPFCDCRFMQVDRGDLLSERKAYALLFVEFDAEGKRKETFLKDFATDEAACNRATTTLSPCLR